MSKTPDWGRGDIVSILGGRDLSYVLAVVEAEYDPKYCYNYNGIKSSPSWMYGLRDCDTIRLATIEDVNKYIKYHQDTINREQKIVDDLESYKTKILLKSFKE
jgi:hypothetical protein